jgi:hypothetical protein
MGKNDFGYYKWKCQKLYEGKIKRQKGLTTEATEKWFFFSVNS